MDEIELRIKMVYPWNIIKKQTLIHLKLELKKAKFIDSFE